MGPRKKTENLLFALKKKEWGPSWPAGTKGHLPAIEGVVSRDDVGAVLACQELNAIIEGLHCWPVCLALLNDIQGVPGPPTEQAVLTG